MPLFKLGGTSGVTSVGLTAPSSILAVTGSPVTTAGVLALALVAQAANLVWAGPTSGAPADPAFRALVAADIPDLSGVYQPLSSKLTAFAALADGAGVLTNDGSGVYSWVAAATGTVTSVGLSVPSFLSVAGSPVTTSGTLAVTLATQAANLVFAGPGSGGVAAPTFRALVAADIPDLSTVYQPLNAKLTAISALANAAGALTNDGSGGFSYTALTTPGGSNTQVQFNDIGAFGAVANFTFDKTNNWVTLDKSPASGALPAPFLPARTGLILGGASGVEGINIGNAQPGLSLFGRWIGGTRSSLSVTTDGAPFIRVGAVGYDGTNHINNFVFRVFADGNWSGTNNGVYWQFSGVSNGSTTIATWLTLRNGLFQLPTYTTAGFLVNDASGNVTSSASPAVTGFTMNTSRILGRTTAGSGAVEEITAGTSLSLGSGSLNTIQDIRTTATPQWTRLGLGQAADASIPLAVAGAGLFSIPAGGTMLTLNASTGTANTGGSIIFQRGASNKWSIGTGISIGSDAFELYDRANSLSVLSFTPVSGLAAFVGNITLPSLLIASGALAGVQVQVPAGGGGLYLNASTGTANTGMNVTWARGASSKWNLGTGISLGSDAFELFDRANGVSALSVAASTSALTIRASLTTGNPSGGTAVPVKFGSYVGGAPAATGYQQIEINGTAYKLLCST